MDSKYDFGPEFESTDKTPIVYVREVAVADLPREIREQAMGLTRLYAVHDSTGERLALVKDRRLAFMLARQNDMAPVSVH